jgi:hypothetical protein
LPADGVMCHSQVPTSVGCELPAIPESGSSSPVTFGRRGRAYGKANRGLSIADDTARPYGGLIPRLRELTWGAGKPEVRFERNRCAERTSFI